MSRSLARAKLVVSVLRLRNMVFHVAMRSIAIEISDIRAASVAVVLGLSELSQAGHTL